MRMRAPALLLLSLWLAPSLAEAGLFGDSKKKKLPKPIKMVHIRSHDAKRWTNPTKLSARYGPEWGRPRPLQDQDVKPHLGHYVE